MFTLVVVAALLFAMAAFGSALWAIRERGRAEAALVEARELRARRTEDADALKGQAALTANAVAEELLKRADAKFDERERTARERLEAQLTPVARTLSDFQQKVDALEKARAEETGGLKQQIEQMLKASIATQDEARKLSRALGRGAGVQGRWGEEVLKIVLERAGLRAGQDFEEQRHVDAEGSAHRPDTVVRLPGGGVFVVDSKCSLTAFDEAQNAVEETDRAAAMLRHVASLKNHVDGLSRKAYWDKLEGSPDFVAMFVPSEGLLAPALDLAPDLIAAAMDKRVVIVTPTSLFGLCKVVALGWRAHEQARNAREVADLGRELYKRIAKMADHVTKMGKGLTSATDAYNAFVGSLERQVLSQARRFEQLKVEHQGTNIAELEPIDVRVREVQSLAPPSLTLVEVAPNSPG